MISMFVLHVCVYILTSVSYYFFNKQWNLTLTFIAVLNWNRTFCFICFCFFVSTIINEGANLTFELIFHNALKYGIIAIWKRDSVSLSMLSAKQENYWYHFFNSFVWCSLLSGIEPRTSTQWNFTFVIFSTFRDYSCYATFWNVDVMFLCIV